MYDEVDFQFVLLAKTEASSKKNDASTLVLANVNSVKALWCDFNGEGHTNGHYVPERYIEKKHYTRNYQEPYP